MCDKVLSEDPFKSKYCYDRYKTQEICNKSIEDFLPASKFVLDWFVTSKMVQKLFTALYADDNTLFFDEYSGNITLGNQMGILSVGLNNINLDDTNYDADDPKSIFHIISGLAY